MAVTVSLTSGSPGTTVILVISWLRVNKEFSDAKYFLSPNIFCLQIFFVSKYFLSANILYQDFWMLNICFLWWGWVKIWHAPCTLWKNTYESLGSQGVKLWCKKVDDHFWFLSYEVERVSHLTKWILTLKYITAQRSDIDNI